MPESSRRPSNFRNPSANTNKNDLVVARRRCIGSLVFLVLVVFTLPFFINTDPIPPKKIMISLGKGQEKINTQVLVTGDSPIQGTSKATVPSTGVYLIQVATFYTAKRAKTLRDNLEKYTPNVRYSEAKNKVGRKLYVVEATQIKSYSAALKLQQTFLRAGLKTTIRRFQQTP